MCSDIHPTLLKHWRGMMNTNYSWARSLYHAAMYRLLEPFLRH